MDTSQNAMWDPLGDSISSNSFLPEQQSLVKKIQSYRKSPSAPKKELIILGVLPVIVIALSFISHTFSGYAIILSGVPVFAFYYYLNHLEEELILFLLCEKNQWAFNPTEDYNGRIKKLVTAFPQVFNQGHGQEIEDQIWGNIQQNGKIDFWRGTFKYTTGSGRSSQTHTRAVFMIRLQKTFSCNFTLAHAGLFSRFSEDIKTESEEFNKTFQIVSDSKDVNAKTQIITVLSPSVQVRLVDFAKKFSVASIHFQENIMTIVFNDEVWKLKYTNFFKNIAIDERDETVFFATLKEMTQLPSEMVQFIQ